MQFSHMRTQMNRTFLLRLLSHLLRTGIPFIMILFRPEASNLLSPEALGRHRRKRPGWNPALQKTPPPMAMSARAFSDLLLPRPLGAGLPRAVVEKTGPGGTGHG